jgi:hypothetical protein
MDDEGGYQLLVRVAIINADDTLSLPVRELWARRVASSDEAEYIKYNGNSAYDEDQEHLSLTEANDSLRSEGGPWLRSLEAKGRFGFGRFGGSDRWFPTSLVRAEQSFWQKLEEPESSFRSPPCHIIDEEKLKIWLKLREKKEVEGADEDDDEEEWTAVSDDGSDREGSDAAESESEEEVYEVEDEDEEERSEDGYEPWDEANDPNGDVISRPTPQATIDAWQIVRYATVKVDDDTECMICCEQMTDEQSVIKLPCAHIFCEAGILKWLNKHDSCPICRAQVSSETAEDDSEEIIMEGDDGDGSDVDLST